MWKRAQVNEILNRALVKNIRKYQMWKRARVHEYHDRAPVETNLKLLSVKYSLFSSWNPGARKSPKPML